MNTILGDRLPRRPMFCRHLYSLSLHLQHGRDGRVAEGDPGAAGAAARRQQAQHQALAARHRQVRTCSMILFLINLIQNPLNQESFILQPIIEKPPGRT